MTDTANAPERIWTADTTSTCSVGFNTPSLDYKNEYVLATHCDELVAAAYLDARDSINEYPRVAPEADEANAYDEQIEHCQGIIDARTPDNARAALTARDERMKAEGAEAADEEAFARGANWAQEKARVEGRLVIVDSPELATLRADLAEAQAKIARLTMIANELSWSKKTRDISNRLFAALQENADEK